MSTVNTSANLNDGSSAPSPVYVKPGDNLQAIVDAYPEGTTFVFQPGVYNNASITPKSNQTFVGQNGAVLSGSVPVSGWTHDGNYWSTTDFPASSYGYGDGRNGLAQIPEDLMVDGNAYLRVGSLADLQAGDFYYNQGKVYIQDDPTGHVTTATQTNAAFNGSSSTTGVTIENLTVTGYANFAQHGAIQAHDTSGWKLLNVNAVHNHGAGVAAGSNMLISGGNYSDNGQIGIHGFNTENLTIDGVTANNNNYAGYAQGWDAGGIKILNTSGTTVKNSTISGNNGTGLWFDTDNTNVQVLNNTINENQNQGIQYEASYNALIQGNTLEYNARSGYIDGYWGADLLIHESSHVQALDNTVIADGGQGIGLQDDARPAGSLGPHYTTDNTVEHNTIAMLKPGLNGAWGDNVSLIFNGSNQWDYNTYIAQNPQALAFTWSNKYVGASGVGSLPIDHHSQFVYVQDPAGFITGGQVAPASAPPTLTGMKAGQTSISEAAVKPFSSVVVADPNAGATDQLTITLSGGGGTLSGAGLSQVNANTYLLAAPSGSLTASRLTAALNALSFKPTFRSAGTPATTTFGLSVSSSVGGSSAVDNTTSVIDTHTSSPPVISGTKAGQTSLSEAAVKPFSGVTVSDPDLGAQDKLTITVSGQGGTLRGSGLTLVSPNVYTLSTSATGPLAQYSVGQQITNQLRALSFVSTAGAPNTALTSTLTLSDTNSFGATSATDSTTTVVDTHVVALPVIRGTKAAQLSLNGVPVKPFAGVTVADPNPTGQDTLTITLSGRGGSLSGVGLNKISPNVYTLATSATGPLARYSVSWQISSELDALIFKPDPDPANPTATTTFALSDVSSAGTTSAVDNATTVSFSRPSSTSAAPKTAPLARDTVSTAGTDQFVFSAGQGSQLITGFEVAGPHPDILNFSASPFTGLADMLAHTTAAGGDVTIQVNAKDSITLQGVSINQLKQHTEDFLFHS